jgi:anti-sigma regulatory factor (Ser/Thr protein kinase)
VKEWTFEASVEQIPRLTEQIEALLEGLDCPMKAMMQISVAIDELMANVASYAYAPGKGDVTVRFDFDADTRTVAITFIDSGIPYDPLAKPDPDVTLGAEERKVGGLGIFLVRNIMDEVKYTRSDDGKNILSMTKKLA